MATADGEFILEEGEIFEKGVTPMRSFVAEPLRHGRHVPGRRRRAHRARPPAPRASTSRWPTSACWRAGCAASSRTATSARLDAYSDRCLQRVWRVQHFSWWMTSMFHRVAGDPFEAKLQRSQLRLRGALARGGDDAGRELRGTGPRRCLISSPTRGGVPTAVGDRAWLQAMLDAEAALARARELDGADAIAEACSAERFDISLARRRRAGERQPGRAAGEGAAGARRASTRRTAARPARTSSTRRRCSSCSGRWSRCWATSTPRPTRPSGWRSEHRSTPMAARTLLQQALPTTFGLKAAGWMTALDGRRRGAARRGAAGAARRAGGDAGRARPRGRGALRRPSSGWPSRCCRGTPTARPVAAVAGALGAAAGAIAKAARDVTLLSQTEVARGARGGAAAAPRRCRTSATRSPPSPRWPRARQAPGLVATLLASMEQEHERAAGAWHAEWRPLRELLLALRHRGGVAARVPRGARGRRRAHARQPRARRPGGRAHRRRARGRGRRRRGARGPRAQPS